MDAHIATWHQRYRLRTPAARGCLDTLAHGPVLDAYAAALERVFGDDPTVYLIRRVEVRFASMGMGPDLVRLWGERLAAGVVRAVAHDPGDGSVVRFPSVAAHVAAFVAELLAGRPADDWTFAPFAEHRRDTVPDTVRAVLLAHVSQFGAVAGCLHEADALPRLFTVLDRDTLARLWADGIVGALPAPDADRPLFAAALRLLERAGWPVVEKRRADAWFADYLATGPAAADWRDRTSLASGVLAAASFLLARPEAARPAPERLDAALGELDWLDAAWLAERLRAVLAGSPQRTRLMRRRAAPTARQQEVLTTLHAVLSRLRDTLDRDDPGSARNRVLLYAALVEARPALAEDPTTAALVQRLLAAARAVAASPSPREVLRGLREGDVGGQPGPIQAVAPLGLAAVEIVESVLGQRFQGEVAEGIETEAAGVFLLLRAVSDLRLAALVRDSGYPADGLGQLLITLGACWAGLPVGLDPGLALLGGIGASAAGAPVLPASPSSGALVERHFQRGLARLAIAHRLVNTASPLRVAVVPFRGGQWLFAGDETAQVWPLVAPFRTSDEASRLLESWECDWRDLTGQPPVLVVPQSLHVSRPEATTHPDDAPAELPLLVTALERGCPGPPEEAATCLAAAHLVIRAWARWLKQLGGSSVPYLLGQFIRRPGRVCRRGERVEVELEPRPLDVILRLSGYFEPAELPPGLPVRSVRFRLRGDA